MVQFKILNSQYCQEDLGYLPDFLSVFDTDTAAKQINENYGHGGGWSPMNGWERVLDTGIRYPGDPTLFPWAMTHLRDETIYVYPSDWVMIVQANGDFEISRID